jgi:hypothetical protein
MLLVPLAATALRIRNSPVLMLLNNPARYLYHYPEFYFRQPSNTGEIITEPGLHTRPVFDEVRDVSIAGKAAVKFPIIAVGDCR